MKLDEAQIKAKDRIVQEPTKAALIASITGSGKTATALAVLEELGVRTVLVIAPGNTFQNPKTGWRQEVKRFLPESSPLQNQFLLDRKNIENFDRLKRGEPGVYYVTHTWFTLTGTEARKKDENGQMRVTRKQELKWNELNSKLDAVILDEAHALANRKGQGAKALKQLHPRRLKIAMSATPGGDKFEGMWNPTRWLWPTTIDPKTNSLYVDRSFWRWAAKWGTTEKAYHSNGSSMVVSGEKNPGEFANSLPCYIRDEPPSIKVPVNPWYEAPLTMTPKQQEQYNSMLKSSIAWINDNPLVAQLPISQKVRLRQMCLGEVSLTPKTDKDGKEIAPTKDDPFPFEVDYPENAQSAKINALIRILTERHTPEESVVVYVGDSQKFVRLVTERLIAQGIKAAEWSGKTSKAQRRQIMDDFMQRRLRVIVASISAISDGTDGLQTVCNIEVWMNKSLYSIKNEQAEGRLNRRGQHKDHIIRYDLVHEGTADEETFELDAKKFLRRMAELEINVTNTNVDRIETLA